MNTFALISLGILIGSLFAALLVAIAIMAYSSYRQRSESAAATGRLIAMQRLGNESMLDLRRDVTAALSAMDANRLHDASIAIQLGAKKLDHAVTSLNKVIFAAGMSDNMNLDTATLDDMQDTAVQRVIYSDQSHVAGNPFTGRAPMNYPPVGQFPTATPATPADPFARWRQDQQDRAAAESGASLPTQPAGPLPDLDAAYLADLSDPDVMSDAGVGMIPGMTNHLEE